MFELMDHGLFLDSAEKYYSNVVFPKHSMGSMTCHAAITFGLLLLRPNHADLTQPQWN